MARESTKKQKERMLAALEKSLGIVTTACREADIPSSTFYKWKNNDDAFATAVEAISDVSLDFAESRLFQLIEGVRVVTPEGTIYKQAPNVAATIFYLKTKGKRRGYIEQTNVGNPDGTPLFDWIGAAKHAESDRNITDEIDGPATMLIEGEIIDVSDVAEGDAS